MKQSIGICVVGGGRVGNLHSTTISRFIPHARIVAIVDPIEKIRKETAKKFGVDEQFEHLDQALEKVNFEGVVITTPTPTHKSLCVTAANYGKHIFLEKPMALNLDECDEIINASEKKGVILQLGFMRRFDPDFSAAAERIESGEIGQPMMIKSNTHGPGLPPPWARDLRTSNGMLAEVNSHDWDAVRWLMNSNFNRVYTEIANFKGSKYEINTPNFYDNALTSIQFESGGLGMISGICPCDYGYDARVEIVGELGIIQIGELRGQSIVVCNNREKGLITPIFRTWPERFAWGYINEIEHFIECIQAEKKPKVGGEEGRWAVAGVLAGTRSFLEERPVYLKEILNQSGGGLC